jgi:hypothetical protein
MMDRCDSDDALRLDFPPSADLLDAVDAVVAMTMRLRYAEGMAQVCLAAMEDPQCWDQDLKHALGLLSSYLTALRQGMARWRTTIVHDPDDPATDV